MSPCSSVNASARDSHVQGYHEEGDECVISLGCHAAAAISGFLLHKRCSTLINQSRSSLFCQLRRPRTQRTVFCLLLAKKESSLKTGPKVGQGHTHTHNQNKVIAHCSPPIRGIKLVALGWHTVIATQTAHASRITRSGLDKIQNCHSNQASALPQTTNSVRTSLFGLWPTGKAS